jgi:DNA invertase Pin-like site-specific DNA recombinase
VESLDRVSRQNPWDALPIFQQIINAGVTMVTLFDAKVYSREDLRKNPIKILESLFVMIRANEESETKSGEARLRGSPNDAGWPRGP